MTELALKDSLNRNNFFSVSSRGRCLSRCTASNDGRNPTHEAEPRIPTASVLL